MDTIVTYSIGEDVKLDVVNHAADHDKCTIVSTLCNVMVTQALISGHTPVIYEPGHVKVNIFDASDDDRAVLQAVIKTMEAAEII